MKRIFSLMVAACASLSPIAVYAEDGQTAVEQGARVELWNGLYWGMTPEEAEPILKAIPEVSGVKIKSEKNGPSLDVNTTRKYRIFGIWMKIRPQFVAGKLNSVVLAGYTSSKAVTGFVGGMSLNEQESVHDTKVSWDEINQALLLKYKKQTASGSQPSEAELALALNYFKYGGRMGPAPNLEFMNAYGDEKTTVIVRMLVTGYDKGYPVPTLGYPLSAAVMIEYRNTTEFLRSTNKAIEESDKAHIDRVSTEASKL